MRDRKLSLLLVVLSISLLISIGLIGIVGYNYFYADRQYNSAKTNLLLKDSKSIAANRDSLKKVYVKTISNLESPFDSSWNNPDSLKGTLNTKVGEFYKLKNEIASLLNDTTATSNLNIARQKIEELQNRIEELRSRTLEVEFENKRLNAALKQLSNEVQVKGRNTVQRSDVVQRNVQEIKTVTENTIAASNFTTSELRLSAIEVNNDKELETNDAGQTQKLIGSFTVKNNSAQSSSAELLIVVLQPDGHVLQSSWEGGTFTWQGSKKIYSCKIPFEYKKGEIRKLKFSIDTDNFQKGNYTVQLYHNGTMIGRGSKMLL